MLGIDADDATTSFNPFEGQYDEEENYDYVEEEVYNEENELN